MASSCLVVVATGEAYERYTQQLFRSAKQHFCATPTVHMKMLSGTPGWPAATLYRYHALLSNADQLPGDYIFMVDADMRCENDIGPEILGSLVAVQHPGYINTPRKQLPYERRPRSAAYVDVADGGVYYAGGLVGGERNTFLEFAGKIVQHIDFDNRHRLIAVWHDESHLNRCLIDQPPEVTLSPAYCHPDDDTWYQTVWPEPYERRLVALDKTASERQGR